MVKRILVIGGNPNLNWFQVFENENLHGEEKIEVEMAMWDDMQLTSFSDSGLVVSIKASSVIHDEKQKKDRTFLPDFLIVRSANRGVIGQDWRNILYGLMHSNVPCINSLESLYNCQEKPIVYGKLRSVQKKLGRENFPIIEQTYYPSWESMSFVSTFPLVAKVGTAHAGFGKMKIEEREAFEDFKSVVALQSNYITAEPFVQWDYDFRIQKIGNQYRAFRRFSTNWKGKGMQQHDEDVPVEERYKLWIDEASKAVGMGEDCICALDGVHSKVDGKEYLIELNDSAIGLVTRHKEEDLLHIRDLVMLKLAKIFPKVEKKEESKKEEEVENKGKKEEKKETIEEANRRLLNEIEVLKLQVARESTRANKLDEKLNKNKDGKGLFSKKK